MRTKVQWLPFVLYLAIILNWLNVSIYNFFQQEGVSSITLWFFKLLASYSTLLVIISFCYYLIKNELEVEKRRKTK